jgi:hypothetical protein
LQTLETYPKRFWKRLRKDAIPWVRDNIFSGLAVLTLPLVFVKVSNPLEPIDWTLVKATVALYALALAAYVFACLSATAKNLDEERNDRELVLFSEIKERDEHIRALTPKLITAEDASGDWHPASGTLDPN